MKTKGFPSICQFSWLHVQMWNKSQCIVRKLHCEINPHISNNLTQTALKKKATAYTKVENVFTFNVKCFKKTTY